MSIKDEVVILEKHQIDLVIDVGANIGQTGGGFRQNGYKGRIVSFEPIHECYEKLAARAENDPLWDTIHSALGDTEAEVPMGISKNLVSSSLLPVNKTFTDIERTISYTRQETTHVQRLDQVLPSYLETSSNVHLKIDTQGYEQAVLAGASGVIQAIQTLRMEASVRPVYDGETKMTTLIDYAHELGFRLIEIWPGWRHPETMEALQFDLMFRKITS